MLLYSNNIRLYRGDEVLGKKVIKSIGGNVKGDSNDDIVYLLGEVKENLSQYKNLEVIFSSGHNGENINVYPSCNIGYRPSLTLENFIDNEKKQIVVISSNENIDKGDNISIYNFENNFLKELVSTERLNNLCNIKVKYSNNYKLEVLDLNKSKKYYIDLRSKHKNYLNNIYDENGRPYKNKQCSLSPLFNIYTLDIDRDDLSEIVATQKIIGENTLDILGYINVTIKYVNGNFKILNTQVLLEGDSIEINNLERSLEESECGNEIDFSRIDFIESQKNRDLKIEKAIEDEFNLTLGIDQFKYYYNKVNLKPSLEYQIIAYLEGPLFCRNNGGTVVILEDVKNKYRIISSFTIYKTPIIISNNYTNGYKDLIVNIKENGTESYRILKYNGNSYPSNVINESKVKKGSKIKGLAIISDDLYYERGIEYK